MLSDHSDDEENDVADNNNDDDDEESDIELEGAVGGEALPTMQTDSRSTEERQTSLLDELQKEINRLRLLSPTGKSNSIFLILLSKQMTCALMKANLTIKRNYEDMPNQGMLNV